MHDNWPNKNPFRRVNRDGAWPWDVVRDIGKVVWSNPFLGDYLVLTEQGRYIAIESLGTRQDHYWSADLDDMGPGERHRWMSMVQQSV